MNRKIYLIGMMALAMLFASCKKEEKPEVQEAFSITASTENDESKTFLDGVNVIWNGSESIQVWDKDKGPVTFSCKEVIGDGTQANFTSDTQIANDGDYWAIYPNGSLSRDDGSFTFTMDATQNYQAPINDKPTFGDALFPMAAHYHRSSAKANATLKFYNAFGVLKIQATGNTTINAIKVTDNKPNALWGDFAFDPSTKSTVSLSDAAEHNTLTLNLGVNGVALNGTAKEFFLILPPGCLDGNFSVDFISGTGDDAETVKTSDASNHPIKRSQYVTATANVIRTFSFTVGQDNQGKPIKVQFAPGNLQYQASTNTWRFAEHTWDFIDGVEVNWQGKGWTINRFYEKTANNNPASSFRQDVLYYPNGGQVSFNGYWRDNQPEWIDLFGWGTSNAVDAATQGNQFDEPWHWVGGGIGGHNYHDQYGPLSSNLDGTNWDWSVNAISNSTETGWRTLTNAEWSYLVNSQSKYGFAELLFKPYTDLNSKSTYLSGIVLLPDGFVDPCSQGASENQPFKDAANSTSPTVDFDAFDNNRFTEAGWSKMEAAGAVFLPCAGVRGNFGVTNASSKYHGGKKGLYWSSTGHNSTNAYSFVFQNSLTAGSSSDARSAGGSVRLVREVP